MTALIATLGLVTLDVFPTSAAAHVAGYGGPGFVAAGTEHSVARLWNEELLEAIRHDFARPTVHARNLFHVSVAMYDAWAAYDDVADTYMLGKTVHGATCPFYEMDKPVDIDLARDEAVSYAAYRLLSHRFRNSPGAAQTLPRFDSLFASLGYDASFTSTDYRKGAPHAAAALGNYIAERMIEYGQHDHSNEQNAYANLHYKPLNPPMTPTLPGDPDIADYNRWQPLTLDFIDQSGHQIPVSTPPFLSPEWGQVNSFALNDQDLTVHERDGYDYWVFHDPGAPPHLQMDGGGLSDDYQWTFELVAIWASHLDPNDGVLWDISPASIGNVPRLPETLAEYRDFYDLLDGGDPSEGWDVNPRTGKPYEPQMVPRGDYTRVLAEFWADGPKSETPPGHWFTILNYVNDHPLSHRRFEGVGPELDPLEWDVKAYFLLGAAMHDAAVSAWGIKGYHDYIRPVSAIRAMADLGQSSDPDLPHYHPAGLPLVDGLVELVEEGDPLAGLDDVNVGKIKLYTWRGHDYIDDPETDTAGVGWILAENWWPYQRPTFITPPFAGYISGHSTFSRAAAEMLTKLTGDEYFPGGMGQFFAPKDSFLVFEDGPSVDVTLQWATYRDASDQTSLSRIWGGIHPPADDIPGRKIGIEIAAEVFALGKRYFEGAIPDDSPVATTLLYPNPVSANRLVSIELGRPTEQLDVELFDASGRRVQSMRQDVTGQRFVGMELSDLASGLYFVRVEGDSWETHHRLQIIR
ncbi:MAG: T9SS type A sorting domain-containing protein [Candidatus Eisenbacteria bacterium]|uniref:T9SS type A sorting domain-containing protein n=1 Tax=Eiseniibacteriota bacterium TaxID=2212470 RepID=A0A956LV91_UNCEI|nr:T9SS type A sorting domain-containing protein [Candidatus Eisenbacteria bacterium]